MTEPDELSLLKTNLSAKLETLKSLDTEIAELIQEDDLEEEIIRADSVRRRYTEC